MDTASSIVPKLAEALICLSFLSSAVYKTLDFDGAGNEVAARGLPQPHLLAAVVIGLQLVASALAGCTTLATLLERRWWTLSQEMQAHDPQVLVEQAAIVGDLRVVARIDLAGWRGGSRS